MARETFRPMTADEQKFIRHFCRLGATEDRTEEAERLARLKRGAGAKMLKLRHVAEEISRRKAMLESEQAVLDARDLNRRELEEEKRQTITLDRVESKLYKLLELDPEKYGALVHQVIQTCLVYTGTIRNGNMMRTIPADPTLEANRTSATESSFYRSIFQPLRAGETPTDSSGLTGVSDRLDGASPIYPDQPPPSLNPDTPRAPLPPLRRPAEASNEVEKSVVAPKRTGKPATSLDIEIT